MLSFDAIVNCSLEPGYSPIRFIASPCQEMHFLQGWKNLEFFKTKNGF